MAIPGWNPLFELLASLKLAVVVLVLLAAVMGVGTFIESLHGAQVARQFVYDAAWFDLLIGLLGLNVLFAALRRWPWKRRHLGFLTVHAGILIILVGSSISRKFGIEGQLSLLEGETGSAMRQTSDMLHVQFPALNQEYHVPADWRRGLLGGPPWRFSLSGADTELVVTERLAHAQSETVFHNDGDSYNPAVHFKIAAPMASIDEWLLALSPRHSRADFGLVSVSLARFESDEELAAQVELLRGAEKAAPPKGTLWITMPGLAAQPVDVDQHLNAGPVSLADSTYQIEIVEYMPNARVAEGGLVNVGEEPNNPFVRARFVSPNGATEEHLLFSLFPDFATLHGRPEERTGAQLRYEFSTASARANREVRLFLTPHERILAFVPGATETVELALGTPLPLQNLGISFTLLAYYPNARMERIWVPAKDGRGVTVAKTTLQRGDETWTGWLQWGASPTTARLGDQEVRIALGPREIDLGFAVQLLDFENPTYGGTTMAARYYSKVKVLDPALPGGEKEVVISMNEPLDHGRFRLFQSSYQELDDGRFISVFSVAYDPGLAITYIGSIVMVLGIVVIFYFPAGRLRKSQPTSTTGATT